MLRWLSSKHGRSSSSSSTTTHTFYRVSLDLPNEAVASAAHRSCPSADSSKATRAASAAVAMPESVQKVTKGPSHLRRRSLPALHLQEDQSAAMMSNPPVFTNPLRRRGCCDHQHTEQMAEYRSEAIQREQASMQTLFCVPLEAA